MSTPAPVYAQMIRMNETGTINREMGQLDASVSVGIGYLCCKVAGYVNLPASANASTGRICGIAQQAQDNSAGSAGALDPIGFEDGVRDFINSGSNALSKANEGHVVYAADYQTVSSLSTDGPPCGKLVYYNAPNALPGRLCRVRIEVDGKST